MIDTSDSDTIAALATAPGHGALAIIRLSGAESRKVIERIFQGRANLLGKKAGRFHGYLLEPDIYEKTQKSFIDQVVLHTYISPHSFTGEDMVEINCHGGPTVVQKILAVLFSQGVRPAEPGEFSRRAFLNGKIDLLQAESIDDIINAKSGKALQISIAQLYGELSLKIDNLVKLLRESCVLLEVELDFSEEIELVNRSTLSETMQKTQDELKVLLDSFHYGRMLREGTQVVIAGKVNVGKSSLLNRLLQFERAIVSDIPGTTRDSLEEGLRLGGHFFRVTDTAGLRNTPNEIEQMGVMRSRDAIASADILMVVLDASRPLDQDDHAVLKLAAQEAQRSVLYIFNKMDLVTDPFQHVLDEHVDADHVVRISCLTGEGFELLQQRMVACVEGRQPVAESAMITRVRHYNALQRAQTHLLLAKQSMGENRSAEFITLDLRLALSALSEMGGPVSSEDILQDIFLTFCIGK